MIGRFGFCGGKGQGRGRGMRRRLRIFQEENQGFIKAMESKGYKYIGRCRCGLGPNALWQDSEGKILHTKDIINKSQDSKEEKQ